MPEKLFAHVNNESDRQALIALHEKEVQLRDAADEKDNAALHDWKKSGATTEERAEIAALMTAINEIASKYDHLMPQVEDPFADLYNK